MSASMEGHFCQNCECGIEHGCVCGWCDVEDPIIKEMIEEGK